MHVYVRWNGSSCNWLVNVASWSTDICSARGRASRSGDNRRAFLVQLFSFLCTGHHSSSLVFSKAPERQRRKGGTMNCLKRDEVSTSAIFLFFGLAIFFLAGAHWFWSDPQNQKIVYGFFEVLWPIVRSWLVVGVISSIIFLLIVQKDLDTWYCFLSWASSSVLWNGVEQCSTPLLF